MHLNWIGFDFNPYDGYGRYARHLIRALTRLGAGITPINHWQLNLPGWMQHLSGLDWSGLSIACVPPFFLRPVPGRQWSLSMTEGDELPEGWAGRLNLCERVIVPCEHNAEVFRAGGVTVPVHVVPGGTCPAEFPLMSRNGHRPAAYTFLSLADRGSRKGWPDVWAAFYRAFGPAEQTPDVRLIIKARPGMSQLVDRIAGATQRDRRIKFWLEDVAHMSDLYAQVDCFAIPSRSEGWGMPHREAAMMGLPVITLKYSGLDDGHTDDWSIALRPAGIEPIPRQQQQNVAGNWAKLSVGALAKAMRWCYEHREAAQARGRQAAEWLRANQTWDDSARQLLALVERYG